MIPFFPPDLFEADRADLLEIVHAVGTGADQRFILGGRTAAFEDALRRRLGAADAVACSSGTSALSLVLSAMGVGEGDEVVVPALGCAPPAATVCAVGAVPVFADVDPWRLVADPDAAEAAVTGRTRALMPAHLFSVMADMPRFADIARRRGLRLVEDSALAQGGELGGTPAGLWGEAGVFSFVQVKTFGTAGEGGAVVTRDTGLGQDVRMLRNHGQDGGHRFVHHRVGYNSRFDEILAAFQLHRLPGLDARLQRRADIADYYTDRFADLADHGICAPPPNRDGRCFYVYTLLAEAREELRAYLAREGIGSHVYYPRPLPHQPAFAPYAPPNGRWPAAESAARRNVSIPLYPHLSDAQVEHIADSVCAFARLGREEAALQSHRAT